MSEQPSGSSKKTPKICEVCKIKPAKAIVELESKKKLF